MRPPCTHSHIPRMPHAGNQQLPQRRPWRLFAVRIRNLSHPSNSLCELPNSVPAKREHCAFYVDLELATSVVKLCSGSVTLVTQFANREITAKAPSLLTCSSNHGERMC